MKLLFAKMNILRLEKNILEYWSDISWILMNIWKLI